MNRKISLSSAAVLICLAVLLTFMITFVNTNNRYNRMLATNELSDRVTLKLAELDRNARELYIGEIDSQKLLDSIAEGYVRGLGDRYAEYMNAERYAEYLKSNQGRMVGIGIEVLPSEERGGVMEVALVMPDSPAEYGGILEGDYIYKVEGEYISSLGYTEAVNRIRGDEGTAVNLTILRSGAYSEEIEMSFIRAEVRTQSVKSRMVGEDIGYIQIRQFNRETPNEFINAADELTVLGAQKYIFDLRFNPGGDLDGVTETLDFLLPEGPIIRYTYKSGREESRMSGADEQITAPMAVLMNESTASAAELFCAALKDYEKAVLVGAKTFGKGTMQGIYTLSDRTTALKISNARYYPPFSDCYDGIGIYPHVEVYLPEGLLKEKSFDRIGDEEDTQLQAAIKILSE
ncbi:MAG: S41 family peptidase [Oscillospiraceae bacterium]|nr:S41 family peptidase [Oscillospiraceae bacterium]